MKSPTLVLNKAARARRRHHGREGFQGGRPQLMVAFSAIYTLPIAVNLPFNWRDLNPVARSPRTSSLGQQRDALQDAKDT